MKTSKLVAAMPVIPGFTGCKPEETPEPEYGGLPGCRPDVAYPMYGPPACYWDSRSTMPKWLEPSEAVVLFIDEVQSDENK